MGLRGTKSFVPANVYGANDFTRRGNPFLLPISIMPPKDMICVDPESRDSKDISQGRVAQLLSPVPKGYRRSATAATVWLS